ncbi:Hypothetical predicted protein [Paramuricea clavata]|uniref:Uncharacterized protein n=1 Tax=Paramuricea clavata TaxID=317549 RepID=A0A6S7GWX2_PARCT|nr:Hypothetical predicted protein [Paramuricea clavata]
MKIRPILKYASQVWGIPKYLETERVQRRSLRILGLKNDSIIATLKERRKNIRGKTCNELTRIVEVPNNPCNRYLQPVKRIKLTN